MKKWFEKICIGLIFFLSALLLMFFGIRTAGKTIAFARAERIEVINNLVDGISEGASLTSQGKKMQTVVYEYLKAFLRAVAGFEFVPRNDFSILTHIINSLPQQTQVLSFVYHGRDLTISTVQPLPEQVEQMVQSLEKKLKIPQEYEKVVYSYYIDSDQQCVAQITLIARKYDETNFLEELQKELLRPHRTEKRIRKKRKRMEQKKIDRISQLSRLSRERELTEEEKQEQQLLRREYVDSMKNNLRATLQNVVIQHPDGSRTKLKK